MRFRRYGIDLEQLEAKHLEMVRQWRNHEAVRLRMQYRKEISPEAQSDWFKKLDTHNDWYFVAVQNELPFGLFHIKEINWQEKCGEAGGFVGKPELIGRIEPGIAILALMDFAFFILGLDFLKAKYYRGYKEIAVLNQQLGYEIFADEPDGLVRAQVSTARYLQATGKLRKAAERLTGEETRLTGADRWLQNALKSSEGPTPLLQQVLVSKHQ
jgi:hypothetical protein